MFVRHLHYYALCLFLYILSFFVHSVFFVLLLLYFFYFIYKTSFLEVLLVNFIILGIFQCHNNTTTFDFNNIIEGKVIDYNDNSAVIRCKNMNVKVYHSYDFDYGDIVKMEVEQLDVYENSNDNGFNEVVYFKANHIDFKANCVELLDYKNSYSFIDFVEDRLSTNERIRSYQRLFILGIKDQFIEDDYNHLLELSIIHLFALSGMHLHYLNKIISFVLAYFCDKKYISIVSYFLLFLYIINIPYSISLYRAYLMMLLYDCFKKYLNKLDVYWIVFITFLLFNPYYIYNYSFVFSFGIYFFVIITNDLRYKDYYVYLLSLPLLLLFQNKINLLSFVFSLVLGIFVEYFYIVVVLSIMFPILNIVLNVFIASLNNMVVFVNYINLDVVFARPSLSFFLLYYYFGYRFIMKKQINLKSSFEHCVLIALLVSTYFYGKYPLFSTVTMIDQTTPIMIQKLKV